jgi:hypothetical protein
MKENWCYGKALANTKCGRFRIFMTGFWYSLDQIQTEIDYIFVGIFSSISPDCIPMVNADTNSCLVMLLLAGPHGLLGQISFRLEQYSKTGKTMVPERADTEVLAVSDHNIKPREKLGVGSIPKIGGGPRFFGSSSRRGIREPSESLFFDVSSSATTWAGFFCRVNFTDGTLSGSKVRRGAGKAEKRKLK